MKKLAAPFLAVLLSILPVWCASSAVDDEDRTIPDAPIKTLATVNGVPLTDYDVQESRKRVPHGEKPSEATNRTLLQALVQDELIYQKAVELGLDSDPAYRKKLGQAQAQLRAFQRDSLRALFRAHVRGRTAVADSEAQAYFETNSDRIRMKIHVLQITRKDGREQMVQDEADLKNGTPFEEVASRRFPNLPKNTKAPWDIGSLHWNQIPDPWKDVVYGMEPGQVSGILLGPGGRSWILKLIAKSQDPAITFETERGRIIAVLEARKADELYEDLLRQMKEQAKITFSE